MKLSETVNVYPVDISVDEGVEGKELHLRYGGSDITFDGITAAEFLPILQHFIETGELPE